MTPADECRRRFAALRDAYAQAITAGDPIKAGNIARKMAKLRKAAWAIKCLEDRAKKHSPWAGLTRPSNFPSRGTKLDGRLKAGHGEDERAA